MNKTKKKLSVIIPVYNIEHYIEKNIKSLISQSKEIDMEILYVDDGSKDRSVEIIREFIPADDRIKILHKENGGLSSARNFGLLNSSGEYIIFIDGDDYVEKDSLIKMYNEIISSNLDILQGCYKKVDSYGYEIIEMFESGIKNIGNSIDGKKWLLEKDVIPMVWVYMYKREFLLKNQLFFYEGIYHEDMEFTPRALFFASNVKAINLNFYNYVQRDTSIVNSKNIKKCYDLIKIADSLNMFYEDYVLNNESKNDDLKHFFQNYIIYIYSSSIHSAIIQKISLTDLLIDQELRSKLVQEIGHSNKIRYKIMSIMLKYKFDKIYSQLYLFRISNYSRG